MENRSSQEELREELPRRLGAYALLALVGEGGMARVYRARRVGADAGERDIALKVVDSAVAVKETARSGRPAYHQRFVGPGAEPAGNSRRDGCPLQ